jgi:hypothetical protein
LKANPGKEITINLGINLGKEIYIMKKTTKIVGLFIATALVLGAVSSCDREEQVVDEYGNVTYVHHHTGFFGGFGNYFHSSGSTADSKNTGLSGVSPWGTKGSTASASGTTGISSGAKGGIGSSGSSIS